MIRPRLANIHGFAKSTIDSNKRDFASGCNGHKFKKTSASQQALPISSLFTERNPQQCPVRTLRWFPTRAGNSRSLDSGTLSNEENFLREASLCRELFTVVWRYWKTLLCWFGWCGWGDCRLYFCLFFFGAPFGQGVSVEDCMIDSLSCGDV